MKIDSCRWRGLQSHRFASLLFAIGGCKIFKGFIDSFRNAILMVRLVVFEEIDARERIHSQYYGGHSPRTVEKHLAYSGIA